MTIPSDLLRRILECAVSAPSGDNCQPWRFEAAGEELRLLSDRIRGEHFLNVSERASLISCGAALENIEIAAGTMGYAVKTELFPETPKPAVAVLRFRPAEPSPDPLFPFIRSRCTNRRPYSETALSETQARALRSAARRIPGSELHLVQDEDSKDRLTKLASLTDRILFESRGFHDSLFHWIRWSKAQAERTRDGLFIKTLELSWPQRSLFALLRSWPLTRCLGLLGAGQVAAETTRRTYRRSSAIGFLQAASPSPQGFVAGGRLLQRVWLTAAAEGLAFQPLAGVVILIQKLRHGPGNGLSASHERLLEKALAELKTIVPLDLDKAPIMLFRVGSAPPPSAVSLRRPATIETPRGEAPS